MKKLTYLLLVMFAVVLMSTSCEEEDVLTKKSDNGINDGLMTLAQLDGQWYVESYLYDDILFTLETEIPYEYRNIDNIFGNKWFFDIEAMIGTSFEGGYPYILNKEGNTITLSDSMDIMYTYTILSYNTNEFKVEFKDSDDGVVFNYKGGIITFIR